MSKRYQWNDLSGNEQLYLRTVSEFFRQQGSWPTYKYLEHELRTHDPNFDFDETVKGIDAKFQGRPELYRWEPKKEAVLNLLTLSICPGMEEELDGFMKILLYCIDIYDKDDSGNPIRVESTALFVHLKMPQSELCKAAVLFKEGPWDSSSGDPSNGNIMNWSFDIGVRIRGYRNVRTIDDYINVQYGNSNPAVPDTYSILGQSPSNESASLQGNPPSTEVFIVHGHDEGARESVARYLEQIGLRPIILHEQANKGMTIIEKFEKHADVAFAVVLLTPDDVGGANGAADTQKPRARQNVILEWGYFVGKFGRRNVCALYKRGVELPSDMDGLLWIEMDDAGAWKSQLAKELREAGVLSN